MALREWMLAVLLAAGSVCVVIGAASLSDAAGWIVGGVLLAGFGWLLLGEAT